MVINLKQVDAKCGIPKLTGKGSTTFLHLIARQYTNLVQERTTGWCVCYLRTSFLPYHLIKNVMKDG